MVRPDVTELGSTLKQLDVISLRLRRWQVLRPLSRPLRIPCRGYGDPSDQSSKWAATWIQANEPTLFLLVHPIDPTNTMIFVKLGKIRMPVFNLNRKTSSSSVLLWFLGLLHMTLSKSAWTWVQYWLDHDKSVIYKVTLDRRRSTPDVNPSEFQIQPRSLRLKNRKAQIMVPQEFVGAVMELAQRNAVILIMDYRWKSRMSFIKSHWRNCLLISLINWNLLLVAMRALTMSCSEYRPSKLLEWIMQIPSMPSAYRSQGLAYERSWSLQSRRLSSSTVWSAYPSSHRS